MTKLPGEADWVAVGGSDELAPGAVRRATLLGRDLALWRGESGRFHAWDNRCLHRGSRLSLGFVRGDRLACRYHGWHYGEDGICSLIPAHPAMTPPDSVCVPRYAAAEAGGLLWVSLAGPDAPPAVEDFTYCRSLALTRGAEELAGRLACLIFPPAALATGSGPHRSWIYRRDGAAVIWSNGEAAGTRSCYDVAEPAPGLTAITARTEGLPDETRLLALQPVSDSRTILHLSLADQSGGALAARPAAAQWAQRLRWFLEQEGREAVSYNPWSGERSSA